MVGFKFITVLPMATGLMVGISNYDDYLRLPAASIYHGLRMDVDVTIEVIFVIC